MNSGLGNSFAFAEHDNRLTLKEKQRRKTAAARAGRIINAGDKVDGDHTQDDSTVKVLSGWAMSYMLQHDGTRVVTDFILPGEVVCIKQLRAGKEIIVAATPMVVLETNLSDQTSTTQPVRQNDPAMNVVIARHTRLVARLAAIAGLGALERTAHLLLELALRSGLAKASGSYSYVLPVTQSDLADALGLTNVHINRVLKELRLQNLISIKKRLVQLKNIEKIIEKTCN